MKRKKTIKKKLGALFLFPRHFKQRRKYTKKYTDKTADKRETIMR